MQVDASKLIAAADEVQKEMCCIEHPISHVLCLRNIGHGGQHWYMVRWQSAEQAIEQAREALRGLEPDA